ncbi:hypothetical protein Z949_1239 [Sulfitobacter guttiformis KCTC 32187]|nr:hypothetical protein Z949_1239 [Sulfitobacter guttiformis KCTC 32187]
MSRFRDDVPKSAKLFAQKCFFRYRLPVMTAPAIRSAQASPLLRGFVLIKECGYSGGVLF